ncbi:RDD family protein [Kiloniella antarctica]|uniref:RDD family protein n=1 Tax=Kiloniella antarctica TaxID=1550907 RepID=A0ABW5BQ24_9PROT
MNKLPSLRLKNSKSTQKLELNALDVDGVPFNRVLAYLIDLIILFVVGLAIGFAAFVLTLISIGLLSPITSIVFVLLPLLPLAYHSYFLSQQGATPGMNAMGLKMFTMAGDTPTLFHAALTTVIFYLSVPATSFLILLVVFFNKERRTLHDLLTSTIVVNDADEA